jgi:cysteine-rich repeat protein
MKTLLRLPALFIFLSLSVAAHAAEFTVDRTDDPDPATADGCDDAVPNDCSLRGAIRKSNVDIGLEDVIHLPANTYTLSIPGSAPNADNNSDGDLDILGSVSLVGEGAETTIIDGNRAVTHDRVLDINPGANALTVSVSHVTITGGGPLVDGFTGLNGAGGGVAVHADHATLDHVIVRDNITGDGLGFFAAAGGGFGGGVFIDRGTTLIKDSVISGNVTGKGQTGLSGGISKAGGAGGSGGGIFVNVPSGASVTIQDSTINGNQTGDGGPGIAIGGNDGSEGGPGGPGGGIELETGTLILKNVTVANNKTGNGETGGAGDSLAHPGGNGGDGGPGGGIHTLSGTLTLNNVTVTGNTTGHGGPAGTGTPATAIRGVNGLGGGLARQGGTFSVGNSIVAGNTVSTNTIGQAGSGPDCNGNFTSNGFNLIGTNSGCVGFTAGVNDDLVNTDPLLDPGGLKDNGGPTPTVALSDGSPAIDTGQNASCETNDQRGSPRVDGDSDGSVACDRGAFEFEVCGDGQVTPGEECDDGNTADGDGCSASCENETGGSTAGSTGGVTGGSTGGSTTGGSTGGSGDSGGCSLAKAFR